MAQQLRALAALPDDPSSILSTHMATHNTPQLQGTSHILLDSTGTTFMQCTDVKKGKTPIYIKQK